MRIVEFSGFTLYFLNLVPAAEVFDKPQYAKLVNPTAPINTIDLSNPWHNIWKQWNIRNWDFPVEVGVIIINEHLSRWAPQRLPTGSPQAAMWWVRSMWGNQHFLLLMDRSGTKLAGNIEIFMVVDISSESARSRSFSVHPQLWMPGGRKLDVEGLVMIGLYCAGLDDRYPIMSYTHGNLWTRRLR